MTTTQIRLYDFAPDKSRAITTGTNNCYHCGIKNQILLYTEDLDKYRDGAFIQDAFPYLNADDREIIQTGIHSECWNAMFSKED